MTPTEAASVNITVAVKHLARAAALMELDDPVMGAEQTWFVVRALCVEHGIKYDPTVEHARRIAPQIVSGAVNLV